MARDENHQNRTGVNPGYAAFQVAKALTTSETSVDAAIREGAREKAKKWAELLAGMLFGKLDIGTRQPTKAPVWATPEVLTGGFATGKLLAGGPLQAHEEYLLTKTGAPFGVPERQALNSHFLSETGLAELESQLRSGCYDIKVPEEGALLVFVWLVSNGHIDAARTLISALMPHFDALRFYPIPAERPHPIGNRIHVESVGAVLEKLGRIQPNRRVMALREAVLVWTPLYERMTQLFLETVEGEFPSIQPDSEGRWVSPETGRFAVVGGWPCRHYAADWKERASCVWADIERMRAAHRLCGKPSRDEDSFARLCGYLVKCANDPRSLTGRDVGMIRLILARHIAKHGVPNSEKFFEIRARQMTQIAAPLLHDIAAVVQERLSHYPQDSGIESLDAAVQPVTAEEASSKVPLGTCIPESIYRKVSRGLSDTVEELVARDLITSGDTLARVVPQISSGIRAAAFDDPHLRRLYSAIYRAFRQRRSLLLLNLEKQVQIEELPWISAVEPFRRKDVSSRDLARQTLKELTSLVLRSFPHAIIPNKLVQEFIALAKGAKWNLPLVEELAADIFMGDFSPKFTDAAKHAAESVDGSLYARYYELDCGSICKLQVAKPAKQWSWFRRETPNPLVQLCAARAGADLADKWDVVRNGMIIEQVQIITTHNLAVLFNVPGLAEDLESELREMSNRCFEWICKRLQVKSDGRHAALIALKNTAYAWRQMVFYLSRLPSSEVQLFLTWAETYLSQQEKGFQCRFGPALKGLKAVHEGRSLDDQIVRDQGARRFVGWTKGPHWLLGK